MATQGLLYLTSGALVFVIMLMILRELGSKNSTTSNAKTELFPWLGTDLLKIVDIKTETHDIKTFRLQRDNGGNFPQFKEGQFLSFQIGDDEKTLRSYSISSSALNLKTIDVSIKLLKDGVGSGWFHSRAISDTVTAFSPNGLFTTEKEKYESKPLVLVAGGIGITPFLSMIKTATEVASTTPMYLFYGARTKKDLAFHDELLTYNKRFNNFNYIPVLSENSEGWNGQTGFITTDLIKKSITHLAEAKYFFCGPPILTDSVTEKLLENNVSLDSIHSEKFASPASFDKSKISAVKATIKYNGTNLDYDGKESILEFFEEKNQPINFACRVGVCGSCKCKLISGEVDVFSDSGLTPQEVKEGYIQTCVARPLSDIELSL